MMVKISCLLLGLLASQVQAVERLKVPRSIDDQSLGYSDDARTNTLIRGEVCINPPSPATEFIKRVMSTMKTRCKKGCKKKCKKRCKKEHKNKMMDKILEADDFDEVLPCTLGPRNEDTVARVIDMAVLINSGQLVSLDRTQFNPNLSNTAINFGAGGACFTTTFEINAVEFVIKIATERLGIPTGLLDDGVMREYKLCDNQTYQVSLLNANGQIAGGFDATISIVNPNLKLSCSGCIIEGAYPADSPTQPWAPIGVPDPIGVTAFFGPNPVLDPSGLVVDGLTFTLGNGAQIPFRGMTFPSQNGSRPVQIRNVAFRDMNASDQLMGFFYRGSGGRFEISNVLVENVTALNIISPFVASGDTPTDPAISTCIVDSTIKNVQVGDPTRVRVVASGAAVFRTDFVDFFISNTCVEDVRTEEDVLLIVDDTDFAS